MPLLLGSGRGCSPRVPEGSLSELSLSHVLRGHPKAAAPHPLYSLMLEETFRPTESLRGRKRLAVPLMLFTTHYGRTEKQAQSNFPYLKAPQASWFARGSIPHLAPFPKAHPTVSPAGLSCGAEAGLAVPNGSQSAGSEGAGAEHGAR